MSRSHQPSLISSHRPDEVSAAIERLETNATDRVIVLYQQHYVDLVRLATHLCGDRSNAEQFVHLAFARLHRADGPIRNDEQALPVLQRTVVELVRGRRRLPMPGRRTASNPSATGVPEDRTLAANRRRQVLHALATLPVREREVVVLSQHLGPDHAAVAAAMGVSVRSAASHAKRARAHLERQLGELR